ncbi:MAG: hypothetical protein N2039_10810, partial [Gemmataceae bacterium]|nr:hypothetical protein [Gemmataceae bacterium]
SYIIDTSKAEDRSDSGTICLKMLDLPEGIDPACEKVALSAISMMAEAPTEFFRNLPIFQWRELHDMLDGLSYLVIQKVENWLKEGSEPMIIQQSNELLVLGRICEQSQFRKLAVKYYQTLLQAAERIAFPEEFRSLVAEREAHARNTQRELRARRDAERTEIFIRPGEKGKSQSLEVRSMAHRPEVILQLLPESDCYQVRFTVDRDRRGHPTVIEPVRIFGPRKSSGIEWEVAVPTGERFLLSWHKAENRVRIEAPDKVFVIEVAKVHS